MVLMDALLKNEVWYVEAFSLGVLACFEEREEQYIGWKEPMTSR